MTQFYIDPIVHHGRPSDCSNRTEAECRCYAMLDALGIEYDRVDHDPAATIAICEQVDQVLGTEICKNLFLCNRQKTQFYLLLLRGNQVFHTKDLSKQLGCSRLSFASAEDMKQYLGLLPGSASVLGLMNDTAGRITLVIDKRVAQQELWGCHPCINTASLRLRGKDILEKFLPAVQHSPIFVDLPEDEA